MILVWAAAMAFIPLLLVVMHSGHSGRPDPLAQFVQVGVALLALAWIAVKAGRMVSGV